MNRFALVIVFISSALLAILSWNVRPTSYLHSWNQITTLTHISFIKRATQWWNTPIDYVTRLPQPIRPVTVEPSHAHFRVYEEPPLYHVLAGIFGRAADHSENAGRILSIIFFAIAAMGVYHLAVISSSQSAGGVSLLLFVTSFPVLYYGCAIMSDMAMVAGWTWSLVFLARYQASMNSSMLAKGLVCAGCAGLFKSYGLIALIPWCWEILRGGQDDACQVRGRLLKMLALCCAALPTVMWHLYALTVAGHQEYESHSLWLKVQTVFSFRFWNAVQKGYFRYLSYVTGAILICVVGGKIARRISFSVPSGIWSAFFAGLCFIFVTADKIPDHDYYLLMPSVPLFVLAGSALWGVCGRLSSRHGMILLGVAIVSGALPAYRNVAKALSENPDVAPCAETIREVTQPNELLAVYTDVSRYNSLSYYAERFSIRADGTDIPAREYKRAGAAFMVTNLPADQSDSFRRWLFSRGAIDVVRSIDVRDYKGIPRVCAVYRFT